MKHPTQEQLKERAELIRDAVENLEHIKGKPFAHITHGIANLLILEARLCPALAGKPDHDYLHLAVSSIIGTLTKSMTSKDVDECANATKIIIELSRFS